jgi:hypothetical protein
MLNSHSLILIPPKQTRWSLCAAVVTWGLIYGGKSLPLTVGSLSPDSDLVQPCTCSYPAVPAGSGLNARLHFQWNQGLAWRPRRNKMAFCSKNKSGVRSMILLRSTSESLCQKSMLMLSCSSTVGETEEGLHFPQPPSERCSSVTADNWSVRPWS